MSRLHAVPSADPIQDLMEDLLELPDSKLKTFEEEIQALEANGWSTDPLPKVPQTVKGWLYMLSGVLLCLTCWAIGAVVMFAIPETSDASYAVDVGFGAFFGWGFGALVVLGFIRSERYELTHPIQMEKFIYKYHPKYYLAWGYWWVIVFVSAAALLWCAWELVIHVPVMSAALGHGFNRLLSGH